MKPSSNLTLGTNLLQTSVVVVACGLVGCGSDSPASTTGQSATQTAGGATGGVTTTDGGTAVGGVTATTGVTTTAGSTATLGGSVTGGTSTGSAVTTAGDQSAVGVTGTAATGASSAGTSTTTGGTLTTTGDTSTGGTTDTTTSGSVTTGGATTGSTTTGGATTAGATTAGATTASATTGSATTGSATTGGGTDPCTMTTPLSGGTERCSNGLGDLSNGYSWEVWMDSGSNCATLYDVGAAFRAEWSLGSGGDFLARAGLFFGSTETHTEIGTISADYSFTKPGDNGFSWVAVYGWTFEPLTEYYIVEDWTVFRPATDYEFQGTISVDGGTYDIYRNFRENAASPAGTTDFDQYWSVRQEPRQCGHVSISAHFNEWNSLGMDMGLLRESMLVVEALNESGTVDFTYATVQVD